MKSTKLNGKDLITTGIYTALYIVAIFIASIANVTPLTFMFYPAVASLLGAVFFVMLATKVQKPGAIIIWGIIVGLLFMVLGMAMAFPFIVVGAVIAQLLIIKAGYTDFKVITLAYALISVLFIGGYAQLFVTTDQYLTEAAGRGLPQEFVNGIANYATLPFLLLMIVVSVVFAILGCLFAKKILKKHLLKAGVL